MGLNGVVLGVARLKFMSAGALLGPLALVIALSLVGAGCAETQEAPSRPRSSDAAEHSSREAITGVAAHLRALQEIANRHDGTRAAGTPGDRASADYIAERLSRAGYDVTRQRIRFPYYRILQAPKIQRTSGALPGGRRSIRPLQFTRGGSVEGPVRRAGRGCTDAETAGLRRGDVALVRRGECTFLEKGRRAQTAGAAALLVAGHPGDPLIDATLGRPGPAIPVLFLAHDTAKVLTTGERLRISLRTRSEMRASENVLADAPAATSRRIAMLGAHLDSAPAGAGLNDNGSGVAAALDIAERLAAEDNPPRVRFGFWAAEELGLIGSRRYVERLGRSERRAVTSYLNLDMVGSPHPRPTVYASDSKPAAARLERLLLRHLRKEGISARVGSASKGSDHLPFARAGIPVAGLFTGAGRPADPCYHRRCDTLSNVNVGMTRAMADTARRALVGIARD